MANQFNCAPMPAAFWSQVDVRGSNECWNWRGAFSGSGYGSFTRKGYGRGSHRVAFALGHGVVPSNRIQVLHTCDNPKCCNPRHLRLGSQLDNIHDMITKGRAAPRSTRSHPGMAHGRAKLTDADVLAIRASSEPLADLAARLGVTKGLVSQIRRGRIWRHLLSSSSGESLLGPTNVSQTESPTDQMPSAVLHPR